MKRAAIFLSLALAGCASFAAATQEAPSTNSAARAVRVQRQRHVAADGASAASGKPVKTAADGSARKSKKPAGRPARITSDSTVYNRKEGIVSLNGHVHVDDEQYQMHADRVFLFLEKDSKAAGATNKVKRAKGPDGDAGELRRIVAIGNVAMTNEMKRAYGAKATYSRKNGLVVLYSGNGITAEVRDESKSQPQIVRGKRIRFWIGTEQVEVDEADLTGPAPSGGANTLKKALRR
jgi:lipopolysaccharide export system protein LptA